MSRLPHGVRDHLPIEAARRRGLAAALSGEFTRWGYRAVITPLYEYDEVLRRGMGEGPVTTTRFVEPSSGEIVALRPDLTPQVARLVATRLIDEPGPIRLFYEGSVVRGGEELFQVGVELIDAPKTGGDREALTLAVSALRAAGAVELTLDLGHAAVAHAALAELGLDDDGEAALHAALLKKDAGATERLASATKLPARRKKLLAALPSLYGGVEALARAKKLLDGEALGAIGELEDLVEQLKQLEPQLAVSIDLGEVRGFRYYSGTRFSIYAAGAGGALLQGGRYDHVVERYGRPARATGFAVDVDALAGWLQKRGTMSPAGDGGILVAGEPQKAAEFARLLRARGLTAVLDLDVPAADSVLLGRAARHGLAQIVVVKKTLQWFGRVRGNGNQQAALLALASSGPPG